MTHLATIPLGPAGLVTAGRALIDPFVVLTVNPEILLDPLLDV